MTVFIRSTILVVLLIGIGVYVFSSAVDSRQPPKVEQKAEAVIPVRQLTVNRAARHPLLFSIGTVEPLEYTSISSPVEAEVLAVYFREGQEFKRGQSLLKFDLLSQQHEIESQEAGIVELQSQLESLAINEQNDKGRLGEMARLIELAESEFARNQLLVDKNVIPAAQLEGNERSLVQSRLNYAILQGQVSNYATQRQRLYAQIDAADSRLAQSKLLLKKAAIKSPFAGRMIKVHASVGERMGRGAPLFDLYNPNKLRLKVALPQRYANLYQQGGERLQALLTRGQETLTLTLTGINPLVEQGKSSVDTYFTLPGRDWILGSVWDIVIRLPKVDSIAVPPDAIYNDQSIYAITEERAFEVTCQRLGVSYPLDNVSLLLECPSLADNTPIVANQLPNLFNGIKVSVVETVTIEAQ